MDTIPVKYSREFWVRITVGGGVVSLLGLVMLLFSRGRLVFIMIGVVPITIFVLVMIFSHRKAVRAIDSEGVTRRDGKRLPWSDLKERRDVQSISKYGQPMGLNNIDLIFGAGKASVFVHVIEDSGEIMAAIEKYSEPMPTRSECSICTLLRDTEWAMQKHGREEEDTELPAAAWKLETIRELKPGENRSPILKQCPECRTFYVYKDIYDYLATGSEDEQRLTRYPSEVDAVASVS